jgi:hypothetical protein
MKKALTQKIYIDKGKPTEKMIGSLDKTNKIFFKKIWGSVHIFRVLNAIGIDSNYLNTVLALENYKIVVEDQETGKRYAVMAQTFKEQGQYFHFKNQATDHHTQLFLPIPKWRLPELTEEQKFKQLHLI